MTGLDEIERTLRLINGWREQARDEQDRRALSLAERVLETLFATRNRLVTYGTLRPGGSRHDVVASIPGTWREGWIRGELHPGGWGAVQGYPAVRLSESSERLPVHVLESDRLTEHWARLDDFEGSEYVRKLTLVRDDDGRIDVANVYEARAAP